VFASVLLPAPTAAYICLVLIVYVCLSFCLHCCLTMYACLCVCPSVCLCMSVCMSVYLYACMSVHLSICSFVRSFVRLSVCLSICLSVCLSICMSVCLPEHCLLVVEPRKTSPIRAGVWLFIFPPPLPCYHPRIASQPWIQFHEGPAQDIIRIPSLYINLDVYTYLDLFVNIHEAELAIHTGIQEEV